ncbi:DUF4402 domain-containing protein [Christiangramia forsetii]|uniref:Secreted protein n=2 Tax=Christiangramia forsetii TaxID=411153 RepID=A0M1N6_CHRFK|nr:DUF4402 domain-containing protein [Christiangramia forsetii]GGG42065.1 hypothetical protein GCM10011532_27350 [Christiangramia forsetii]CAL66531.1 secreted protein [Christiangramia forsetii KT0803]
MKKLLFFLFIGFCTGVCAQHSASASVNSTAVVVDPIEITKNVDLHFGNVISSYNPGKLILSPEGSRTAFGIQISPGNPGQVSAAEAIVKHGSYNYSITLPENFTLFNENNSNQFLIIDEFTVNPEVTGEEIDILKIGATLNLEANQPSGFYTNSSGFNVTVSYN